MTKYVAYVENLFGRYYLYRPLNPQDDNYGKVFWNENPVNSLNDLLLPELCLFNSFNEIRRYLKYIPPQNMKDFNSKKIIICSVQFNETEAWKGEIK